MVRRFDRALRFALAASGIAAVACGSPDRAEDAGAEPDGDVQADGGPGVSEVAPPEAAPSPVLTPCPPGWREVADPRGVATCDPWPARGAQECADDEVHLPGAAGCAPVGTACPAGDWADDLPIDVEIAYVKPDAPLGGDGSQAQPYRTIARAVARTGDGGIVAISRGVFEENVPVDHPVTLWGACVAETVVVSTLLQAGDAAVWVTAGGAAVRNLTIAGSSMGLSVTDGGVTDVDSVVVRGPTQMAVSVGSQSTLRARRLVLRDAEIGLGVHEGGRAELTGVAVERASDGAVLLTDEGSVVVASDLAIRGTGDEGEFWAAVTAVHGARVELAQAALLGNEGVGISLFGDGTQLTATDLAIQDTRIPADGFGGYGLEAYGGASATLERTSISQSVTAALLADDVGTTVTAADFVVRDTGMSTGGNSDGIAVGGARVSLDRTEIAGCARVGILLDTSAELSATDLAIRDPTVDPEGGDVGFGVVIQGQARATLGRLTVERSRITALLIAEVGSRLEAEDVTIRDVGSATADGRYGNAVVARDGAAVRVTRMRIESARSVALGVLGEGTEVALEDGVVEGTLDQQCAETSCTDETAGIGLFASGGSHLEVTRFRVQDSVLSGLFIARGGGMDLHDGIVSGSPIGAIIQGEGFDISRLQDRVRFLDNRRNLESSELAVPSMPAPLR